MRGEANGDRILDCIHWMSIELIDVLSSDKFDGSDHANLTRGEVIAEVMFLATMDLNQLMRFELIGKLGLKPRRSRAALS